MAISALKKFRNNPISVGHFVPIQSVVRINFGTEIHYRIERISQASVNEREYALGDYLVASGRIYARYVQLAVSVFHSKCCIVCNLNWHMTTIESLSDAMVNSLSWWREIMIIIIVIQFNSILHSRDTSRRNVTNSNRISLLCERVYTCPIVVRGR